MLFSVRDDGSIISEVQVFDSDLVHLGLYFQTSHLSGLVYTYISLGCSPKSILQEHEEKNTAKGENKDTALLNAIFNVKELEHAALVLNDFLHIIME